MAKVDYISFAICAAFFLVIIPNISLTKIIYVSPNNYTQVLENANSGDIVIFKDGTYNLSEFGGIEITKSLHLKSENGPEKTILLKGWKRICDRNRRIRRKCYHRRVYNKRR